MTFSVSTESSVRESSESGEEADEASVGRGAFGAAGVCQSAGKVWCLKHRSQQRWASMFAMYSSDVSSFTRARLGDQPHPMVLPWFVQDPQGPGGISDRVSQLAVLSEWASVGVPEASCAGPEVCRVVQVPLRRWSPPPGPPSPGGSGLKIQGGKFRRLPNPGDHVALLPGVDVRCGFSGPVAQVLALAPRNVQLEGAIRDEDPEGVPREFLHLWAP